MSTMLRRVKGGEEKEGSEYRGEGGERKGQNELQYAVPGGLIGKTVCHMGTCSSNTWRNFEALPSCKCPSHF